MSISGLTWVVLFCSLIFSHIFSSHIKTVAIESKENLSVTVGYKEQNLCSL